MEQKVSDKVHRKNYSNDQKVLVLGEITKDLNRSLHELRKLASREIDTGLRTNLEFAAADNFIWNDYLGE